MSRRSAAAKRVEGAANIHLVVQNPELAPSQSEQAQDDMSRFFANTLGMLCIASYDGYFTRLNPAWTKTLGWTLKQLQSRPCSEFVHPDDRAATRAEALKLVFGGRMVQFENRYLCKDGSYKWLRWSASSLPARRQIHAIACDVTESRSLRQQLLEAADREKERLGRELHDGVCQNLAAIAALNAALSGKLARCDSAYAAEAAKIGAHLNRAVVYTRDLARGLSPVDLPSTGIAAALDTFAVNVQALFGVACHFRGQQPFRRLAPDTETHLFRVAQQAVGNAITHGRGRHIEIDLSFRDAKGCLSIRDDGIGIAEPVPRDKGIGLHTMDYRAQLIGGALQVRRIARGGTAVVCTFPLLPDTAKDRYRAPQKT